MASFDWFKKGHIWIIQKTGMVCSIPNHHFFWSDDKNWRSYDKLKEKKMKSPYKKSKFLNLNIINKTNNFQHTLQYSLLILSLRNYTWNYCMTTLEYNFIEKNAIENNFFLIFTQIMWCWSKHYKIWSKTSFTNDKTTPLTPLHQLRTILRQKLNLELWYSVLYPSFGDYNIQF